MSNNSPTLNALDSVFGNLLSIALTLVAVACLVMLVVGGFQFLAAGGNKEGAQRASHTLTYSIAGLILAISAWIILSLLGRFLGLQNVGVFSICVNGSGPTGCL